MPHPKDHPVDTRTVHWDDLWSRGITPWDRKGPSTALEDAVLCNHSTLGMPFRQAQRHKRKRALVPACGRGYDVLLLASLGYDAYLLRPRRISSGPCGSKRTAEGMRWLQYTGSYAARDPLIGQGQACFIHGDFFDDAFLSDTAGAEFDLIFDYTLLCALPPDRRPSWARRISELLSPTGHIVCLEWPLAKDPKAGGPPHALSSELYVQLSVHLGREVQYDESGAVLSTQADGTSATGLVRVAHYMPERTHDAAKGQDFISIWERSKDPRPS